MIGPYYRPQLTSMLSITHRATGVFLAFAAFALAFWLLAIAGGPDSYARFEAVLTGPLGFLLLLATVFSLAFHFFNGIRHLFWDVGWGLDLPRTYASGYAVMVASVVATALVVWLLLGVIP